MVNEYDDEPELYISEETAQLLAQLVEYNGKWYFPDEIPNQDEETNSKPKTKRGKKNGRHYRKIY